MMVIGIGIFVSGAAPSPPHGCLPPHDTAPWCNMSLAARDRAELVVAQLTTAEVRIRVRVRVRI